VTDTSLRLIRAKPAVLTSATAPRVLVIEDERIVAADLQSMLRGLGYDAYATVSSGRAALELAREQPPKIALTDIRIDGSMDGIETAVQLHRRYGVSIVFLTAHADDATVDRAKEAEPCGYLLKPFSAPALKAAIELSIDRQSKEARMQLQQLALTHTAAQLTSALDHVPLAVQVEDAHGRIIRVNPALCSLFGIEEAPSKLSGSRSAALMDRIRSLCIEPEQFTVILESTQCMQEPVSGEPIALADGRKLERDYVPVFDQGERRGQMWTYRDVSQRERERLEIEERNARNGRALLVDELTGLSNRRGLYELAAEYLKFARARSAKILFFADLNGLKDINDRLGHAAGDAAICDMAQALRATFTESDLIARLGGDEFVVLATVTLGEIETVRARLSTWLDELNARPQRPYRLEASLGAAEFRQGESLDELLSRADKAMYLEKRSSRHKMRG
jgi:diguanylate cyclase (GGDEF)-like protein